MRVWRGYPAGMLPVLLILLAQPVWGQESMLTLSGDPQPLVISTAVAGFGPDPVWDEGTTYSLTVTEPSAVEAQLDAPLPPGVTLLVQLEPPSGALGAGPVALSSTPQVLVSSIPVGTYTGLGIRYQFAARVEAGVVPVSSRRITFTITSAP